MVFDLVWAGRSTKPSRTQAAGSGNTCRWWQNNSQQELFTFEVSWLKSDRIRIREGIIRIRKIVLSWCQYEWDRNEYFFLGRSQPHTPKHTETQKFRRWTVETGDLCCKIQSCATWMLVGCTSGLVSSDLAITTWHSLQLHFQAIYCNCNCLFGSLAEKQRI